MIIDDFKGYREGADITKISVAHPVYPSKNVIVTKGKIVTRGGLTNDGNAPVDKTPIHSEYVWKDAFAGVRPIRCTGNKFQVKYDGKWLTVFEGLADNILRMHFATWVDGNEALIRKRLFFTDGSSSLYQWNGAIAEVDTYTGDVITVASDQNAFQLGFDNGTATNQKIVVVSRDSEGTITENNEYLYENDAQNKTLDLTTTPTTVPKSGDVVIGGVIEFENAISESFNIDAIFSYQNHIAVASYNNVQVYLSSIDVYSLATGLDFSVPTPSSRTALSPILIRLDGNFTAMISRKNTIWISDADDWYKGVKTIEQNAYDTWINVEKFETGDRKGALPMACTIYKRDIIYLSQDKTLQRISSIEILNDDDVKQISDEVDQLFKRLDLTNVRLYFFERAIYIICPEISTLIMFDLLEGYYQPPQIMPISCMSIIDGILHGHHNDEDQTFEIFKGEDDLGVPIENVIAFPYFSGNNSFRYKKHTMLGISCRISRETKVSVDQYFEENGAKSKANFEIDGLTIESYAIDDDVSWATHPYGSRSWGGADMEVADLRRAMVFNKVTAESYFDFRPILTINGTGQDFQLLGWHIDSSQSNVKLGNDLFISK